MEGLGSVFGRPGRR